MGAGLGSFGLGAEGLGVWDTLYTHGSSLGPGIQPLG